MKVKIDQRVFLRALQQAGSFMEKRNTIPVLAHGLFSVDGDVAYLQATNMEQSASVTIADISIIDAGDPILIPLQPILEVVRKLPQDGEITLETRDDVLKVSCGRYFTKLSMLDALDFPPVTTQNMPFSLTLPAKVLLNHFKTVEFAISTEETRYYLNGVFFHEADDGSFVFVATDGHRLAKISFSDGVTVGTLGKGVIIPRGFVSRIASLLDRDGDVEFGVSDARISLTFPELSVSSKLIDGSFPDYQRVIPQGNDHEVIFDSDEFSKIIARVSVIHEHKSRPVKLSFGGEEVVIMCTGESGSAQDSIDLPHVDLSLDIGFQARYLLDVIGASSSKEVRFLLMQDSCAPCIIQPKGNEHALFVLMPMRV